MLFHRFIDKVSDADDCDDLLFEIDYL